MQMNVMLQKVNKLSELVVNKTETYTVDSHLYCDYNHIQFFGKQFSPEFTHREGGFIMRRNHTDDFPKLSTELQSMFPSVVCKVRPREGPNELPQKIDRMPLHEGDQSFIFLCMFLKPMTEKIKQLYKPRIKE